MIGLVDSPFRRADGGPRAAGSGIDETGGVDGRHRFVRLVFHRSDPDEARLGEPVAGIAEHVFQATAAGPEAQYAVKRFQRPSNAPRRPPNSTRTRTPSSSSRKTTLPERLLGTQTHMVDFFHEPHAIALVLPCEDACIVYRQIIPKRTNGPICRLPSEATAAASNQSDRRTGNGPTIQT